MARGLVVRALFYGSKACRECADGCYIVRKNLLLLRLDA
jgi:hypothetical protein